MPRATQQGERRQIVTGAHAGLRLDKVLVDLWPDVSRALWQRAILDEQVLLDGAPATARMKPITGSVITVLELPRLAETELIAAPQPKLLYEDADVLVFDKPAGLITHPKPGAQEPSLAGAVASLVDDPDKLRPGIVHRLDKDTSGVVIVAKTEAAKAHLQAAFRARAVQKLYWALVWGELGRGVQRLNFGLSRSSRHPGRMEIDPVGKPAETFVEQLTQGSEVALVAARPVTGRTHQIRVHLAAIKHPILGDHVYGRNDHIPRQMLHARELTITLPSGTKKTFTSSLPDDFVATMKAYSCPTPN